MSYLGEFTPGKTISRRFNSHKADGTPSTFSGSAALTVYKQGSSTPSASGVTLTTDYNSKTGLNNVVVDTSVDGTFYAAGSDFDIAVASGLVDGVGVTGIVVGTFSLSSRAGLRPTIADRTIDVSAGGEAGLDWANIGTPTATVALTGTTVGTTTNLTNLSGTFSGTTNVNVTGWLGVAPSALISGRVDASLGSYQSGQAPLQPTVVGRTLDVTANGNAGIDWANIDNPGTTVDLYGTTLSPAANRAVLWTGEAQAGGASTVTLDSTASSTDGFYKGATIVCWSGTGSGQAPRLITDYSGSTKVAYVAPQWVTTPTSGTKTALLGVGPVDVQFWKSSAPNAMQSGRVDSYVGDTTGTLAFNLNGSVTGNLYGKVLGSGAATITGAGARVFDSSGNVIPTATGIASTIYDTARSGHNTAGSFGETLTSLNARLPGAGTIATTGDVPTTGSMAAAIRDVSNTSPAASGLGWMVKRVSDRAPAAGTLAVSGDAMALTSSERTSVATSLLDMANGVETSITVRQSLRGMAAVLLGLTSGANTSSEVFKAIANSGVTRVTGVVDSSGNRSSVILNL